MNDDARYGRSRMVVLNIKNALEVLSGIIYSLEQYSIQDATGKPQLNLLDS